MLQNFVASMLSKYLGEYILGLEKENLKLEVSSGKVQLDNLEINPSALSNLNYPLTIHKGTLNSLTIPFAIQ